MDVAAVLQGLGGSGEAAELVGRCGRRALERAVRDGTVVRVARGRYVLAGADRVAEAVSQARGVRAGLAAAQSYGWGVLRRSEVIDVAVPLGRPVPGTPGVRYRWTDLTPAERQEGRTSPLRTALGCAAHLPFVDGLVVADSALRSGLVLPVDLRQAADAYRGRGAVQARRVARHADPRAANAFESGLRGHLLLARITAFVPQHVITAPGFFAAVDLADPDRRVAVEADGWSTHGTRRAFAADLQRHDELAALGWVTLRFAWEHVMSRPGWVVGQVRDVLRRRRPTGGSRRTGPRTRTDQRQRSAPRRDPAA